ncbi:MULTISPECIES: C40 family peptidase [unclassified Massilia]|uniref:C40 family peptidase n=1 Tax=unclassified Massilia TaxID=2609279 RepID=UPI001782B29C|nr:MULTISPECIES: C40 family peptidase [unclassified Massilia]MBD8531581.1 C40 family peptidase [Massilia sp. CFBP 13647]MBD8673623.1 C40 family peptidase [Massilia sp. CFBP 13721]
MKTETIDAIRAHAEKEFPREACGLVLVVKGRERYLPCTNAAQGTEHFVLPAEEYAAAETLGDILAVVHSHPGAPAAASQADLVSCEASGVPWHIVRVDLVDGAPAAGEMVTIEPSGYRAPLVGRQFSHGVLDCYQLIVDWYAQERSIALPQFPRADEWWNDGKSDLYTEGFPQAGFVKLADGAVPEVGDVILMQIRAKNGVPNHAGIYIGDGLMLHHMHGRLSSRDLYGGWYQESTRAILRHQPQT